jgi:flagellin-like protein
MPVQISSRSADQDRGVSEIIGAILMISVVIAAVAVISVLLLSQTPPQAIPDVNFMTGSDGSGTLYLLHNGGDSLRAGTFAVMIDGVSKPYTIANGGDWTLGKNLVITGISSGAHQVTVVYNNTAAGGGAVVGFGTADQIFPYSTPAPDVTPVATYPPVVSVSQLLQNLTNNSVSYYRENGTIINTGTGIGTGYIQFNITKMNSSFWYTSTASTPVLYQLNIGSQLRIQPYAVALATKISPSMKVIGIGDQIWELTADRAYVTITNQTGSNDIITLNSGNTVAVNHTYITGYKNFQSTLVLSTNSAKSYYTELMMNNYTSYNQSQNFTQSINKSLAGSVTVNNVVPTSSGLFILIYDLQRNSTYFAGDASSVAVT